MPTTCKPTVLETFVTKGLFENTKAEPWSSVRLADGPSLHLPALGPEAGKSKIEESADLVCLEEHISWFIETCLLAVPSQVEREAGSPRSRCQQI
ncbi:hypothetical protein VULLAG_LOCUS6449 [Vulpes lagopus]